MHYMGLIDLEQRAEAEARAASVAAHINNGAGPAAHRGRAHLYVCELCVPLAGVRVHRVHPTLVLML